MYALDGLLDWNVTIDGFNWNPSNSFSPRIAVGSAYFGEIYEFVNLGIYTGADLPNFEHVEAGIDCEQTGCDYTLFVHEDEITVSADYPTGYFADSSYLLLRSVPEPASVYLLGYWITVLGFGFRKRGLLT